MVTRRRLRFIHGQVAWMMTALVALSVLDALSYEVFFVLSLIGLLVLVELTAPINITPRWRSRLKWVIGFGLVVFGYIVLRRALEVLPFEVF